MKTIIFDWGGIILREARLNQHNEGYYCDKNAIIDAIKSFKNAITDEEAYNIYIKTLKDESGTYITVLDDEQSKYKWYKRIIDELQVDVGYNEFIKKFAKSYTKIDKYEEVVNYIYEIKEKYNVNICLFSDLIFVCYEALTKHINLNVFSKVFLSYQEHLLKTDINAFINVENKLNVPGKDILFFDNTEININNAKKRNWNAFLLTGNDISSIKEQVELFLNSNI